MAPEYPPSLVILDLHFAEQTLLGAVEYIEMRDGGRLRVRWHAPGQPEGFRAVGGGVAFVAESAELEVVSIYPDARPDDLGHLSYSWAEGLRPGTAWLMFILVLPPGYSLVTSLPMPTSSKHFAGRVALYWTLRGDEVGRNQVMWQMARFVGEWTEEVRRINSTLTSSKSFVTALQDRQANISVQGAGLISEARASSREAQVKLRDLLLASFNEEEVIDLCFELGVSFENLAGQGLAGKAREVVLLLAREGRLADLVTLGKVRRPRLAWNEVLR